MKHRSAARWLTASLMTIALGVLGASESLASPWVKLTVREPVVEAGGSTVLDWSSSGAVGCEASGDWTGRRAPSGERVVGPVTEATAYVLTCTDGSRSAKAMIGISVYGTIALTWIPPETRVDGSPFVEPAGYHIYFGSRSRDYTNRVFVRNPDANAKILVLPSGNYYFAMTSLDRDGLESRYSNEVIRRLD